MMRFCLMDPRPFSWDRLLWMNRQWQGVVFIDFREEKAPHFILNLVEELQHEGIAESIAPCQTFSKSFMMVSPATKRKDLVLLLRPLNDEGISKLGNWRNNQREQIVMQLSDYIKQYAAEFTGILPKQREEEHKVESPAKGKKGRSKKGKRVDGDNEGNNDDIIIQAENDPNTNDIPQEPAD